MWNVEGQWLALLEGHSDAIRTIAFNEGGSRIVTASKDGTARIWHIYPDVESMVAEAERSLRGILSPEEYAKITG